MAQARLEVELDGAAIVASTIATANSKRGSRWSMFDFHPYRKRERRGVPITRETLRTVADLVCSS